MPNYKEIVTKAVIAKGKRLFTSHHKVSVSNPSTILGCWVINHQFSGVKKGNDIVIDGSYDVNIWYSYDNDMKTDVVKETNSYHEVVHMREVEDISSEEVIIRSLKQPTCSSVEIEGQDIVYTIEKELGIELVGDVKVKIEANLEEEPWDDILEEDPSFVETLEDDFIEENVDVNKK